MSESNLQNSKEIILTRVNNGWIVRDDNNRHFTNHANCFAFESTESLQKNLVRLVGKSGWQVAPVGRDEKGHFVKQQTPKQPA